MKLALVQSNITWEEKEMNYQRGLEWIKEAEEKDVDLILFPEMSFTGFSMNVEAVGEKNMETVSLMTKWAKEHKIAIGFGWVKINGKKGENHYTIITPQGEVLTDYTKMHPFSYSGEDKHYVPGDAYEVVTYEGIPLTTFICYDLRFPMGFWKASENAHFIIVPANWPKRRVEQWKTLLQARAIENQVYIAAINCVGKVGDVEYSGASCFINPKGQVIKMVEDKEELIVIDWVDDVDMSRRKFPVHMDRRPEER